jgi:hypothetical protein
MLVLMVQGSLLELPLDLRGLVSFQHELFHYERYLDQLEHLLIS